MKTTSCTTGIWEHNSICNRNVSSLFRMVPCKLQRKTQFLHLKMSVFNLKFSKTIQPVLFAHTRETSQLSCIIPSYLLSPITGLVYWNQGTWWICFYGCVCTCVPRAFNDGGTWSLFRYVCSLARPEGVAGLGGLVSPCLYKYALGSHSEAEMCLFVCVYGVCVCASS